VGVATILLMNGPNLELLGTREPEVYGYTTLAQIENACRVRAEGAGTGLQAFQSSGELELIRRVHAAKSDGTAFIVINPGAFTHTSVALRDALAAVGLPYVEVHLSNVHAREPFRRHSYLSDRALGVICGLGPQGYAFAIDAALAYLERAEAAGDDIQTGI
jgi:3-dehydroquinate dehydratase-2